MIVLNKPCFLSVPNQQNKRVLIPGIAVRVDGAATCQVEFAEPIETAAGGQVTLYADWRTKFHQQPAEVLAVETIEGRTIVSLKRLGEPSNCESRGAYRVSTISQDIRLTVDKQVNALLADLSVEGLSVIVHQPLSVGTNVDVNLQVESIAARGTLRVQTEKKLPDGRLRYGLYAYEKRSPLCRSLEMLSSLMQRRQLQRLSRAG